MARKHSGGPQETVGNRARPAPADLDRATPRAPGEPGGSGGSDAATDGASPPPPASRVRTDASSIITDDDIHLFNEGTHYRLYGKLGAHVVRRDAATAVRFAVWAPNANYVAVVGDFNNWDRGAHPMRVRADSGIWETTIPDLAEGERYKFHIASSHGGYTVDKADPFGFMHEVPPKTASVVRSLDYAWSDSEWMSARGERFGHDRPMSIYEVHLGSWMRVPEDGNRSLSYIEAAEKLADHCIRLGFTHVELLPIMEHPFFASWGYQTTGYFAPTSRFGTPQDFMRFVDILHQRGVGVILDWAPSHFPEDEHGLKFFDGTHLFEHADPRLGFHPDWKSAIFNYGRHEVRSFLISSAVFWLDRYHVDGLRVDAVASMLYLDYSREPGEWIPNKYGGRENIDAIDFLRRLNTELYRSFPDSCTIAEEATAWPMVSRPTYIGGLGFGYKWDMGWMHDSLRYLGRDSIHRKFHHNELTFRGMYQFSENYVLPLSHDEVVHGKGSLLRKMAGDEWRRFANLRLLLTNQWTQPGKKLLFMGCEIAQWSEWNHDASVDWHLLDSPRHAAIAALVAELNRLYTTEPALHEHDCSPEGFTWLEPNDAENSVLAFLRRGKSEHDAVIALFNYTPNPRLNYRVGAPSGGRWRELFNSDAEVFGGSGHGNLGGVEASPLPVRDQPWSLTVTIPPLAAVLFRPERPAEAPGAEASSDAESRR